MFSAGGAPESLAHHEVVGKLGNEREPCRGDTLPVFWGSSFCNPQV